MSPEVANTAEDVKVAASSPVKGKHNKAKPPRKTNKEAMLERAVKQVGIVFLMRRFFKLHKHFHVIHQ